MLFNLCSGVPNEGDTFLVKDWGQITQITAPEIWVMNMTLKKRVTGFLFDVYRSALWTEDATGYKIHIHTILGACPKTVSQPLWRALRNQGSVVYLGEVGSVGFQ